MRVPARSIGRDRSSVGGLSAFFGVAPDPDEPDAHPAHTEHDHRRYEPGEDRAADHQSVGQRLADAMRHHDRTRAGREMREDEERAEPIMRHEADVPRILDESGGRARREAPSGVDAEIRPCENEDRVHVAQHVEGEVDARGDLEGAEAVSGRRRMTPDEEEPGANLEEEERHHQRLQDVVAVHVAENFHHRVVRPFAGTLLSERNSSASAIAQHATQSEVSGTGSWRMVRTTPTKTNKGGAATASRATRLARNCATVGRPISEKDIAASIAISGIAKARARDAAALSHDRIEAPSAMRATLVWKPCKANG